jgi:hypothetical protein
MRISLAALVGIGVLVLLPADTWADIPPPPPERLQDSLGLRPLPIAVAGLAVSLAVAFAGLGIARYRDRPRARTAALVVAAVVLVTAGALALRAAQVWAEQDALKAQYEKTLANWRPLGPVRIPRASREVPPALAVLAFTPQNSFPHNLPWAALVLNVVGPDEIQANRAGPAQ